MKSPRILNSSWGSIEVETLGFGRDFKLYPGGGRAWDWKENNTHHIPGIQVSDVEELLSNGCKIIILSKGRQLRLQTCDETIKFLEQTGLQVYFEETQAAIDLYNYFVSRKNLVGGLFHSTC